MHKRNKYNRCIWSEDWSMLRGGIVLLKLWILEWRLVAAQVSETLHRWSGRARAGMTHNALVDRRGLRHAIRRGHRHVHLHAHHRAHLGNLHVMARETHVVWTRACHGVLGVLRHRRQLSVGWLRRTGRHWHVLRLMRRGVRRRRISPNFLHSLKLQRRRWVSAL